VSRRKASSGEAAPPGAPLWLASFSDMMTNLLCFFILICAFAMQKRGLMLEDGLGAIKARLKPVNGMDGTLNGSVTPVQFHAGRVVNRAAAPLNQSALVEKSGRILDANRDAMRGVIVDSMERTGRTVVPLPMIYDEGVVELSDGHKTFLAEFARQVSAGRFPIVVEGFAYEDAASDAEGWEISETRARNAADYLASKGVAYDRLVVRGRGMLRHGPLTTASGPPIPQNRYGRRMVLFTLLN
jgi:chemotaxis protein MotB